jgi:basic membrane protein A
MVRDTIDRRTVIQGIGAAGVAGLAGCLGGGGGGGAEYKVGMVYALGGLGDNSFNDMAHRGIQDAEEEFDVSYENAEPSGQDEVPTLQQRFAEDGSYDLICTIGFNQLTPLETTAEDFPDQNFMIVDAVLQQDNVASYVFKEHEGSFQVGHLAGALTTESYSREFDSGTYQTNDDTVVGFVGGKENSLIKRFEAGYKAGVEYADEDVEVRTAYAGGWSDPGTGKAIANSMYDEGADIVYHAAGGTGAGVFQAARERGRFAIGVDSDQSRSTDQEDVIIASMVKHVDTAVYTSVENVVNDSFAGGETNSLGLANDGVEAVIGQRYEGELPSAIVDGLEESRQGIVDGDISVPTEPSN